MLDERGPKFKNKKKKHLIGEFCRGSGAVPTFSGDMVINDNMHI